MRNRQERGRQRETERQTRERETERRHRLIELVHRNTPTYARSDSMFSQPEQLRKSCITQTSRCNSRPRTHRNISQHRQTNTHTHTHTHTHTCTHMWMHTMIPNTGTVLLSQPPSTVDLRDRCLSHPRPLSMHPTGGALFVRTLYSSLAQMCIYVSSTSMST